MLSLEVSYHVGSDSASTLGLSFKADESSTIRPGEEVNVGLIERQRQRKTKWSMGLEA